MGFSISAINVIFTRMEQVRPAPDGAPNDPDRPDFGRRETTRSMPMDSATMDSRPVIDGHRRIKRHGPSLDDSGRWLAAGWQDFRASFGLSFSYGLMFGLTGLFLFLAFDSKEQAAVMVPLLGGYLIVAPALAVGFHEMSRRRETGEALSLRGVASCCRGRIGQLAMVGLALTGLFLAWMLTALVIFALFFNGGVPWDLIPFIGHVLSSPQGPPFLAIGTLVGGAVAGLAYGVSALSIPLILDRNLPAIDAMALSLRLVGRHWRLMAGWAATIALITFCGIVLGFVGLAVALPLAGHASWHAYRGLMALDEA